VRAAVWDFNFEQNIMHRWDAFGFGGGYGTRLRCRNGACPERVNLIQNHWTSGGVSLDSALILGDAPGAGDDAPIGAQVYMEGNRLPAENQDRGAATAVFTRSTEAEVTLVDDALLVSDVLPLIGAPHRTPEETALFLEVALQIETDLTP